MLDRILPPVFVAIALLGATLGITALLGEFGNRYRTLYDSERYLVLLVLALYSAMSFAVVEFGIYFFDRGAYVIEPNLQERYSTERTRKLEAKINQSKQVIDLCNT